MLEEEQPGSCSTPKAPRAGRCAAKCGSWAGVSASVPPWAPSCCCPVSPAPETHSSAPGRAVPSSQARELGAVICLSVHGGGWMQFVKEPPRLGWAGGAAGAPGAPIVPSLAVPRTAAHTSKQGMGTPPLPPAPLQPLAPLPPPEAGGAGRDHPIRYRVSSALPRVTWGLWGWLRSHTELPMEPQQCQDSTGGIAPVSQSGAGHCAGVTATAAQGGQCQGYSLGLTATPAGGSHCAGVSTPPVQGDSARSLPHRHGGSTEQRPLRHHTCAGGQ